MLFGALYVCALCGQRIGRTHIQQHPNHKLKILRIVETAVFGLFGLLIAFTFSGAYDRFQERKTLIIDEANAINSAFLRLDLLDQTSASSIRNDIVHYIECRLNVYQNITVFNVSLLRSKIRACRQIQLLIWNKSIAALKKDQDASATEVLLPALNTMADTANKQYGMGRVHPPLAIFILLFGLALLSSFFVGYTTAGSQFKKTYSLYILSFLAVIAVMLYVIFDLELPRFGFLRITPYDSLILQINSPNLPELRK